MGLSVPPFPLSASICLFLKFGAVTSLDSHKATPHRFLPYIRHFTEEVSFTSQQPSTLRKYNDSERLSNLLKATHLEVDDRDLSPDPYDPQTMNVIMRLDLSCLPPTPRAY